MNSDQMKKLMEAVKDVFDLLPDDQGTAKRLEVANRDGRVAWDVYRDQPQELTRRVKLLAQHPEVAPLYALHVLKQPWHQVKAIDAATARKAKQSIASDGRWAYDYARHILQQPWHQVNGIDAATARQATQLLANSRRWAYVYARWVLRKPWHQAEGIDDTTARRAEQSIASDSYWVREYIQHFDLGRFRPHPSHIGDK